MHKAFDTGLEFNKCSVRNQIDNAAFDFFADRVFRLDIVPRVGEFLLQSKADTLFLVIDVQHNHIDLLPDGEEF